MTLENSPPLIPKTKISATILEFGAPLLDQFEELPPLEVLRNLMKIVITVWNAHALAMPIWKSPHQLDELDRLASRPDVPPWMSAVVANLTERRRERFGNDPWVVGEWTIEPEVDGFIFRRDARLPSAPGFGDSTPVELVRSRGGLQADLPPNSGPKIMRVRPRLRSGHPD